ncbi:MAG: hypothetical protein RLZZ532_3940 [Cyanobacteriota bacterium]|jgi:hypothetical protein|uniref:Ribbon-helix-helix domain-containing protein n=1 Tax=Planktothrix agardhii TaxID=1160 RepID=A0A1J1JLN5_PLAAG|nr:ribbon-helix-helix domain-containing protein [Planktothrix agardhii]CUM62446.1 conserved protein of unknown function [Planktothrix agardhii]
MSTQKRQESGRFAFKSNTHRLVRSIRLTDATWNTLGEVANSRGITRADLIEEIVSSGNFGGLPIEAKSNPKLDKGALETLSEKSLSKLKIGLQSSGYKSAKKAIGLFIKDILFLLQSE